MCGCECGGEGGWIVIRIDRGGKREFSNTNFKPFLPLFQHSFMVLGGSNLEESLPYEMRHSIGSCNILQVRI